MACTIAFLDQNSLQPLLALLDARELCRLVICGNTVMRSKIAQAATRFKLTLRREETAVIPNLLSHFSALTDVEIGYNCSGDPPCISSIDYSLLPSTIRRLKLNFGDALLSTITLPFSPSSRSKYRPRLFVPLPTMFTNLERLELSNAYNRETGNWDFSLLLDELFATGSPLTHFSADTLKSTWNYSEIFRFPRNIASLEISKAMLGSGDLPTFPLSSGFPPHLTSLSLGFLRDPLYLCLLPTTLTLLSFSGVNGEAPEWKHIHSLRNLVRLSNFTRNFIDNVAENLPSSLEDLNMSSNSGNYASLAKMNCPVLRSLKLEWGSMTLVKSTYLGLAERQLIAKIRSKEEKAEVRFVTARLPRSLRSISPFLFDVVSPKDWKLLPRHLERLDDVSEGIVYAQTDLDFLAHLPPMLPAIRPIRLSPAEILQLPMTYSVQHLILDEFEAGHFPVLAHFPNLQNLRLGIGIEFNLAWLEAMPIRLKALEIEMSALKRRSLVEVDLAEKHVHDVLDEDSERLEPLRVPLWARTLERMSIDTLALSMLSWSDIRSLFSLPTLKTIEISPGELRDGMPHHTDDKRLPRLLAYLPQKLETLDWYFEGMDSEFLKGLPNTLRHLNMRSRQKVSWNPSDLAHLRSLLSVDLPNPKNSGIRMELLDFCEKHPTLRSFCTSGMYAFNRSESAPHLPSLCAAINSIRRHRGETRLTRSASSKP